VNLEVIGLVDNSGAVKAPGFADFVPIKLVTILEVLVQDCVKQLIDHGEPYLGRSKRLLQSLRIDFEYLAAVHGRKITVGDLASHTISVSSLDNVIASLSELLPSFKQQLLTIHDRVEVAFGDEPAKPIVADFDELARTLGRLFTVRHIVVHELPERRPYDIDDLPKFVSACATFCRALEQLVATELLGDYPMTQVDMNVDAANRLELAKQKLGEILAQVQTSADVDLKALEASQSAWSDFAKREAELHASQVEGGSMYPMVFSGALEELVTQRTSQLRYWLEREEGDF